MESILYTTKLALGIEIEDESFDLEILLAINTAISALTQVGVGPTDGFIVTNHEQTWVDFLSTSLLFESAKGFILLKVRLMFDPPQNAFAVTAIENQLDQILWRLGVTVDTLSE